MKNYNHLTLIGRTTRDIKMEQINQQVKGTFNIAVERKYKDSEGKIHTDFFQVTFWNKLAELFDEHVPKGSLILITGKIQSKKKGFEIIGEDFTLLSKPNRGK